jgi:hypothetical protein
MDKTIYWRGVINNTGIAGIDLIFFELRLSDINRLGGIGYCPLGRYALAGQYNPLKESLKFQMRGFADDAIYGGDFKGVLDNPNVLGAWSLGDDKKGDFMLAPLAINELRLFNRRYLRLDCSYDGDDIESCKSSIDSSSQSSYEAFANNRIDDLLEWGFEKPNSKK